MRTEPPAAGDIAITVVIPTRDRHEMLHACLTGVLAQQGVEFEVIVVDDGSCDGTSVMLRDLADSRVRVIRHEQSKGVAAARNAGISAARGRWVAFSDDDDLWAPTKLREQFVAGEAVGAALVYCGAVVFTDAGGHVQPDRPTPTPEAVPTALLRGNPLPGGASAQMARAETLAAVGGFDTSLSLLADWDMWIRLAHEGPCAAVSEPLVAYRQHLTNMIAADPDASIHEFARLTRKHAEHGRYQLALDGVGFSYWVASGQRRAGHGWAAARIHLGAAIRYRNVGHLGSAVRSPLGDWAVGLRSPPPAPAQAPPAWLAALWSTIRETS